MKIVVEINVPNRTVAEYLREREAWHPNSDPDFISVDTAYLDFEPDDDSFVLFKLVEVRDR